MVKSLLAVAFAVTSLARADYISLSFSGVWDANAGAARFGDSFTGSASWDDSGIPPSFTGFIPTTFWVSTFPNWTAMNAQYRDGVMQPHLDVLLYSATPTSCDAGRRGPTHEYLLIAESERITLICRDWEPTSLVAHSMSGYQFNIQGVSDTVATPEPHYFGILLLFCGLLAGWRLWPHSASNI